MNAWRGGLVLQLLQIRGEDDAGGGPLGERYPEGAVHEVGQLLGHGGRLHVLVADVFEERLEIDFLLIGTAHCRSAGLAHDGHDRHVVEEGVVEPIQEMDSTRTGSGRTDTDPARELGISHRGESSHLLVAHLHELRIVIGSSPSSQ